MGNNVNRWDPRVVPPAPSLMELRPEPDDLTMATVCHVGGIFTSFLLPLLIWLLKKDQSRYVDDQGKEAVNFQLTLLVGDVIGLLALFLTVYVGVFILLSLFGVRLFYGIEAALAVNRKEVYRYPFASSAEPGRRAAGQDCLPGRALLVWLRSIHVDRE